MQMSRRIKSELSLVPVVPPKGLTLSFRGICFSLCVCGREGYTGLPEAFEMREPLIKLTQLLSAEAATAQGHRGQVTIDIGQAWDRSVRLKYFFFFFFTFQHRRPCTSLPDKRHCDTETEVKILLNRLAKIPHLCRR